HHGSDAGEVPGPGGGYGGGRGMTMRQRLIDYLSGFRSEMFDPADLLDGLLDEMKAPDEAMRSAGGVAIATEFTDPFDALSPDEAGALGVDDDMEPAEKHMRPFAAAAFTAMIDAVRKGEA